MKNLKTPAQRPRKAPSNQTGGTAWGKKLAAEISRMAQAADMKKLILLNFPYIIAFYMVEKAAWLYRHCNGDSVVDRLMVLFMNFGLAYKSVLPSFHLFDLMVGLAGAAALKAVIYFKGKNAKKYRQGEEYGSARWGNQKDIEPFIDPVFENNVILTQTERLMMSGRPKHPKYARNKNVIVIGGSGSGKTRFYVKPNLMQMPQKVSYVLTDPKGTIIIECGKMLSDAGYKIKVLNTINFKKSMRYNPFHYIRSEKDILKLVNTIIANTKGDGEKSGEDFWIKAERLLYCALIGYIWYEAPEEEQNFSTLLEFINASEAREDDEEFKNPVDELFEELEKDKPEHFAVRQYKKYKLAAGKTAKSILISCGARLAPFDIAELRDLMAYDEMELDLLGDRRTALFVIISDTDDTFNFVVSIMYTQLFNLLCDRADDQCGGQLKYHVRLLLDEFANIGLIPKFDKLIATIRSREISASIILQSQSQLKTIYKDAAETIIGNCDTMLFLGGKESSTLKEISETLGKETIDLYNTSDTRGQSPSFGTTYQKTGKDNANAESNDSDNIVVPFKNLLNDSYCRDISIKVRSQLDMKRRKGEFIGGYAIYGYCKDERNKNRLVVDEYAADVVRSIYRRKLEGMSAQAIAEQLNSENVLAPSEYKRLCGLNYHSGFKAGTHAKWQAIQVLRILKNEVYTGTMVQGRRQKINYKIKKIRDVEESGWIRVPNMHEAIIPQKLFDTVQEVLKLDTCASKGQQTVNLFSGIVRCGGCGQNMVRRTVSKNGKKYIYLHCVTNHNGLGCSSHLISESKLEEVVLAALQGKIQQISGLEHRLDEINEIPKNERRLKSVEEHLKMLEQEEQKYQTLRRQLYEDMSSGIVSKEEYKEFSHSFNEKVEAIRKAKAEMNRQRDCLNNLDVEHLPWIEDFKSYQNLTSLNRRVLVELVESITVYDKEHIHIQYRFDQEIRNVLEYCSSVPAAETEESAV